LQNERKATTKAGARKKKAATKGSQEARGKLFQVEEQQGRTERPSEGEIINNQHLH